MRIVKTILGIKEKKRVGGITLPYIKLQYKMVVEEQISLKKNQKTENQEIYPHKYGQLIFYEGVKTIQ